MSLMAAVACILCWVWCQKDLFPSDFSNHSWSSTTFLYCYLQSNLKYEWWSWLNLNTLSYCPCSKCHVFLPCHEFLVILPHHNYGFIKENTLGQVFDHGGFGVFGVLLPQKLQLYKNVSKIAFSTIKLPETMILTKIPIPTSVTFFFRCISN